MLKKTNTKRELRVRVVKSIGGIRSKVKVGGELIVKEPTFDSPYYFWGDCKIRKDCVEKISEAESKYGNTYSYRYYTKRRK